MKRVLVTENIHENGFAILEARDDIEIVRLPDETRESLIDTVKDVHAVLLRTIKLDHEVLSNASSLEIVSRHGVGCDNVDVAHLTSRGIPVAIASGANARSVAEHTLGLMIGAAREFAILDNVVKTGRWADRNKYRAKDLSGSKVLIVGFGRIGRLVAPLCKAFGMDVVVADIALDRELAESMGCRAVEDFRTELDGTDFLTVHIPLDDTTRHIVSEAELAALAPGAVVINCARGGIVDEDALMAALESDHVRAAALDVMSEEPPRPDHPLILRPDVLMVPHNGAAAMSAIIAMAEMAAQNIVDHFDGNLKDEMTFNLSGLRKA